MLVVNNQNLEQLLNAIGINNNDILNSLELIHKRSIELIENNGQLPQIPPFEKHPYLENIENKNITGLMIGTFPPISYLCDTLNLQYLTFNGRIGPPQIPYFHGNNCSLWRYCPIDFDSVIRLARDKQPNKIRTLLASKGIAYTDIIIYCQRELCYKNGKYSYTAQDKFLNNIVLNNSIYQLLLNSSTINRLYFTNASFFCSNNTNNRLFDKCGNYILKTRDAFRLFLKGANDFGFTIEISNNINPEIWHKINECENLETKRLNKLLTNKIILKMRLKKGDNSRILQLYTSVSPAAVLRGRVKQNRCIVKFCQQHVIRDNEAPKEFLTKVLLSFFNNSIDGLIDYNEEVD